VALILDPIYIINLALCTIIFILGFLGYKKGGNSIPLYVGIAFCLFGVSHLATILGFKDALEAVLIVIRTVAYLTVIVALYKFLSRRT
jgi:hypothetical protein